MVADPSKAIYRHFTYGMAFGGGVDLFIGDPAYGVNSYTRFGTSYSVPPGVQDPLTILAGTHNFTPDELETFYLAV